MRPLAHLLRAWIQTSARLTCEPVNKIIQNHSLRTEQYFHVVLLIMLYNQEISCAQLRSESSPAVFLLRSRVSVEGRTARVDSVGFWICEILIKVWPLHEMEAIEQYFTVVQFIMVYKVVLRFDSVDEILKCNHSKETAKSLRYQFNILFCGRRWIHVIFTPIRLILKQNHNQTCSYSFNLYLRSIRSILTHWLSLSKFGIQFLV